MNDKEFNEMLAKLRKLGLDDGDLGYAYWYNVVKELQEMRKIWLVSQRPML